MVNIQNITTESTDWWKWGLASKRKTLAQYPELEQFLMSRFGKFERFIPPKTGISWYSREDMVKKVIEVLAKNAPHLSVISELPLRQKKSIGNSYLDLIQAQMQLPITLVDAIVLPKTDDEVLNLLQIAQQYDFIVIAFGGGTNVVRALHTASAQKPVIVLDTSAMNQVVAIDVAHHTATFQSGILGPALEAALQAKGFTMGHFPQSFEYSTLGGWIATRSAGQESSQYGKIDDIVISLKVLTPQGTIVTSPFIGDADGINLKSLFLGSEGTLGIVTEAKVRIQPLAIHTEWITAAFGSFEAGHKALQEVTQKGLIPAVVRLSDEVETEILSLISEKKQTWFSKAKQLLGSYLLRRKNILRPNLLLLRFDGEISDVRRRIAHTKKVIAQYNGLFLGSSLGIKWQEKRFNLPYLRDDFLEKGFLVDTAETVVPWSKVLSLYSEVKKQLAESEAFGREKGIVFAHLSHIYPNAATIYFTLITPRLSDAQMQWQTLKTITNDAFLAAGAAVSHHHSIGLDNRQWYLAKTDALTLQILNNIKQTLDPTGILNPHKLYHEASRNDTIN